MHSTLNAPLTEAEEVRIIRAYGEIFYLIDSHTRPIEAEEFYALGERVINLGFELRKAVLEGWAAANKRKAAETRLALRAIANSLGPKAKAEAPTPDELLKRLGL